MVFASAKNTVECRDEAYCEVKICPDGLGEYHVMRESEKFLFMYSRSYDESWKATMRFVVYFVMCYFMKLT